MSQIERITVFYPKVRLISRPKFEQYLIKKGWTEEHGLWRSNGNHAIPLNLAVNHLGVSLDRLAEFEQRPAFVILSEIMQPTL